MDVYGIIGNPVGHSLSPPMHEAGFAALGIDARYVAFEPERSNGVEAVESAAMLGVRGLNVTIPFKQSVIEAVEPDELAARIGAVNTVDFASDPPTGHNTDATGLLRALTHHDVPLEGTGVVVGAGGAGRAAAFALADRGVRVRIANRTVETAVDLANAVESAETVGRAEASDLLEEVRESSSGADSSAQSSAVTAHGLDDLDELLADADVLVNATSVGMEEDRSPVPPSALHADLVVLDAVYTPLETRLLRDASEAGATTIDGAWMLLYQGVEAFERWTGEDAPVDVMNDALRSRLAD